MTPVEMLRAADALIPDAAHWRKHMDIEGEREDGSHYTKLCMMSALSLIAYSNIAAARDPTGKHVREMMGTPSQYLAQAVGSFDAMGVMMFNDSQDTTFEAMKAMYAKAIALAGEAP